MQPVVAAASLHLGDAPSAAASAWPSCANASQTFDGEMASPSRRWDCCAQRDSSRRWQMQLSRPVSHEFSLRRHAEVPTAVDEGRGAGPRPEHSYCSWREGLGRQGPQGTNGGERGHGSCWGAQDQNQSPAPSHSAEHRSALSVYDNLLDAATPDGLRGPTHTETSFHETLQEQMFRAWVPGQLQGLEDEEGGSDYNSVWSSCEILLSDQDKGPPEEGQLDWVQTSPLHQQTAASSPQVSGDQTAWPPAGVRPPEHPRVPPPVPLADPSARALRSLLTSLQQQIVKQREEYETQILRCKHQPLTPTSLCPPSLEQRNQELQAEVVQLKSSLAQQRHWYQAVQARIGQSERARAAAERRNATLQREMEQFFDAFGELNNEAK
ncbi:unnamed protein product, partial [Tetraodon nigroviridis]